MLLSDSEIEIKQEMGRREKLELGQKQKKERKEKHMACLPGHLREDRASPPWEQPRAQPESSPHAVAAVPPWFRNSVSETPVAVFLASSQPGKASARLQLLWTPLPLVMTSRLPAGHASLSWAGMPVPAGREPVFLAAAQALQPLLLSIGDPMGV